MLDWARLRATVKNRVRAAGWHVGRANPDSSLGSYLDLLFQHFKIDCVFDVGGHYGEYGRFLRLNGYTGTIVSFEPVPDSFQLISRCAAADRRWLVYPWALGAEDGERVINVPHHSDWASFLTTNDMAAMMYGNEVRTPYQATVKVRRLDSIMADLTRTTQASRLFLKLDTQGWELPILDGAAGCLSQFQALQLEMAVAPLYEGAPSYLETLANLERRGFALAALYRGGRLPNMQIDECDCLLVPAWATILRSLTPATAGSQRLSVGTS